MASVLVTEDEPAINELICNNLKLVGHRCVPAADGETALEILEKHSFDIIILD